MPEQVLLPQIPLHVLSRIALEGRVTYGITRTKSVLLYTDISGFTPLTDALTASGKDGIEEITKILNDHFGRLSRILADYKGVLLKMGGDSLLARFGGTDAVQRAHDAAWQMLDWFKENPKVKTRQGEFGLTIKAILGGGQYREAILGNEEKSDWFPLGERIEELAIAEKSIEPGEIIVKKGLKEEEFPAEQYPTIKDSDREALAELTRSFLPVGRSGRLALSSGGEYRVVAPIFLNLHGYDPQTPDFDTLNESYLRLTELLHLHHGVINKVDIAPQGNTFLLLFGAPVSHEADRANAGRFFCELKEFQSPFKLKAGLSYGAAFAGFIGGSEKEYTVIGQRVNAAAKIMSASEPGEFVITAEARDKFDDLYETRTLDRIVVSGISYDRFELDKTKKAVAVDWTTHDAELGQAVGFAEGESRIIGIAGDHGMGKSRFLHRLAVRLAVSHEVLEVSLDERGAPYQVFRRILVSQAGIKEDDSTDLKHKKLIDHLRDVVSKAGENLEGDELLRRFPFIAGMLFGLAEAQKQIAAYSPELRLENLMDAFRSYIIRCAAARPLAFLIDDPARAEAGSLEMLAFAARTIPRLRPQGIFFFFAYNPEFEEEFCEGFDTPKENLNRISLDPLSAADSKELAEKILGAQADDAIHQFLYERSVGNPSVLEQWAGYLLDKNLIEDADGKWVMGKGVDAAEIPDDLYSLVFSRMDRLPEQVRQALRLGSVYGIHFPSTIIAHITGEENVTGLMAPVVASGLIYSLQAGETEYVFRQTLVRDVCYDSILRGDRERLHRNVAKAVESLYSESLERYFAMLAHHWTESGDWEPAFKYSLASAKENRRLFRNEAAEEDYSRTIKIWEDHFGEGLSTELFDAHYGRAGVFDYQGRFVEAAKDYATARNLAIRKGLSEREVDALNKLAHASRSISDFEHLFEYAGEALRRSQTLSYEYGKAVALLERGAGQAQQGRPEEGEADFKAALKLSQELDNAANTNRSLNNLATLNRALGRPDQALNYYERAIAIAEKSEDKLLLTNNLLNVARLLLELDQGEKAQSYLERTLNIALEIGHRQTIINCTIEIAGLEMMRGDFNAARAKLEEASTRAEELQDPVLSGEVQMRRGHLSFYEGRIEEALGYYEKALLARKVVGAPAPLAEAEANLGNILQVLRRMDEALPHLEESRKLCLEIGNQPGAIQALVGLSSINNHQGRFERGLEQASLSLEIARQIGDAWSETGASLQYAASSMIVGNYEATLNVMEFADQMLESPQMAPMALDALRARATTYAKLGRFNDGLREADRIIEIAQRAENPEQLFMGRAVRLENLIGTGDVETAVIELLELQQLARQHDNPAFQVTARLTAAKINLANKMFPAAAEVLTGIEKELVDWMEETEQLEAMLLLAEAKKGAGEFTHAGQTAENLLERIGERPLPALVILTHLVISSLAARKLRFAEEETQPTLLSRILHPVAYSRWNRHQKAAAKATTELIVSLSPENTEAITALFAQKGLQESRLFPQTLSGSAENAENTAKKPKVAEMPEPKTTDDAEGSGEKKEPPETAQSTNHQEPSDEDIADAASDETQKEETNPQ
jgi:class 3 adenylate cyclase/tetratricopeptide (TPR) repeat protein